MPKALQHNYPGWQDDPHAEDSNGESREVWFGAMRVVSAKRARKLRKRGVPLMPLHAVRDMRDGFEGSRSSTRGFEPTTPNGRARYAWFECKDDAEARLQRRRLRFYLTATTKEPQGRKAWLRVQLDQQRQDAAARSYFRSLTKAFYGRYTMPHWEHSQDRQHEGAYSHAIHRERAGLYKGVIRAAFRSMRNTERVATEWGDVQEATGHALDALAGVPMPAHWTDEQKRHYIQHGYVVEFGDTCSMTATEVDELRRQHRSPPVTLHVALVDPSQADL